MNFEPYIVYIQTDEQNRITAVNSSAFLPDTTGWVKIDEGHGDKYHHAQGNYFDKPIYDDRGICCYKLVDGQPVERNEDEMADDWVESEAQPTMEERLAQLEEENAYLKESLELLLSGVTEDG